MNVRFFRGWIVAFIALLGATPLASLAQVWSMGSNGQMGYHGTPNPVSPNCVWPQVWTWTNGHYACQDPPPPPPPSCPPGTTEVTAPSWNGSAWVGIACLPHSSTPPTSNLAQICNSYAATLGFLPNTGLADGSQNAGIFTSPEPGGAFVSSGRSWTVAIRRYYRRTVRAIHGAVHYQFERNDHTVLL